MRPVASARSVVFLGVSGSGKTTVGRAVAERLAYDFCDADDLHSRANVEKMRGGTPLTDEDRLPWLDAVGERIATTLAEGRSIVVACSALKRRYRDVIRRHDPRAFFVLLDGTYALILSRVVSRRGSFMPPSLLASQFAALEPLEEDESGTTIDVSQPLEKTVTGIVELLLR
jgi:carbohydrate kinase (thermoresistant glucokinase family)